MAVCIRAAMVSVERGRAELRQDRVGLHAHIAIALAYRQARSRSPDPSAIAAAVVPDWLSPSHRAALIQRIAGAVADYQRFFWRKRPWRFVADEEHVGEARVDLVFVARDAIEFDEVKVATGWRRFDEREILAQACRLADSGAAVYGTAFRAVRVVLLEPRPRSCRVRPGVVDPGVWEQPS